MLKTLVLLWAGLTLCIFKAVVAHPLPYTTSDTVKKNSIENICLTSPVDCLSHVELELSKYSQSNLVKYDLLQYRFVALFNLQRNKELREETSKWIDQQSLPIPFKITVYIYHAKSLRAFEEQEKIRTYVDKAMTLLKQMNEVFYSPMRLVELANLQMQYGDKNQAYLLLSDLAKKYKDSKNALFQMELHGNLGHTANKLNKLNEAEAQWKTTLYWSDILGNKQQQAVVRFNLADVHEQLKQLDKAAFYFKNALTFSEQAQDNNKALLTKFRLGQVYFQQQKYCQAYQLISSIDKARLPITSQANYDKLINDLTAC
ncbi:tetratricopeptide repeat protein [Thalassotalea sediminis]|uniref:tetratricopeptide repeat protein n=1 Tax=Thalassotalea sediminis TaxID=1759089 RepID=UPI0025722320|nr:hypothetical protein [Thalassotalea sediminis]